MPESWNELAQDALKEQREPITASTTNIAKFGAPIVAVITAVVTGIFGASTDLSLKDPTTVIAAAIIVAAVVLGVYAAFAVDIYTRGSVSRGRFHALATIVLKDAESRTAASDAQHDLTTATDARDAAEAQVIALKAKEAALEAELQAVRKELSASRSREAVTEMLTEFGVVVGSANDRT